MTGQDLDDDAWLALAGRAVRGTSASKTPAADARELLDAAVALISATRVPVRELRGDRGVHEGGPGGSGGRPGLAGLLPLNARVLSELTADPDSFSRDLRTMLDPSLPLGHRSPVAWHLRVASPLEPGDRLFRLGDAHEWCEALRRMRGVRPDRARELVEAEWWRPWSPDLVSVPAPSRMRALWAFRVGLFDTDVPFLTEVATRGAKRPAGMAVKLLGEPVFHPGPEPEVGSAPEPEPEPDFEPDHEPDYEDYELAHELDYGLDYFDFEPVYEPDL